MNDAISKLHLDILDSTRQKVFGQLRSMPSDFVLGGGTAIALQIRHRQSYDFDFFSPAPITKSLLSSFKSMFSGYGVRPVIDSEDELTILLNEEVKISCIAYPFPPLHPVVETDGIRLFDLRDLASNKAYTIGRRGAWRDYVDLFFLLNGSKLNLQNVISESERRFSESFDTKLFLGQLVYYDDITDFSIEYIGDPVSREVIQEFFLEASRRMLDEQL